MPRLRITLAVLTLLTASAHAQTFEQFTFLRLHEAPMSVRSAGMGAATEAASPDLADLAANPAATAAMKKRVISIGIAQDARDFHGIGFAGGFPTTKIYPLRATDLAHAAIAIPLRGVSLGAYYRNEPRLSDPYAKTIEGPNIPYTPSCTEKDCFYFFGIMPSFERRERRYGITAAAEAGALSFGAGVEMRELNEELDLARVAFLGSVAPPERVFREVSDRDAVVNAGIRWRATPRVALALAYNGAGSFTRTTSACTVDVHDLSRCVTSKAAIGASEQRMPDAYRGSISFKHSERLMLVGELVRRNYSNLRNDAYSVIGTAETLPYRDVTELHAGAEYRVASLPIALRAGWWRDPARLRGFAGNIPAISSDDDVEHTTFGAAWYAGDSRIDLSLDSAQDVRRASIAFVHSF